MNTAGCRTLLSFIFYKDLSKGGQHILTIHKLSLGEGDSVAASIIPAYHQDLK